MIDPTVLWVLVAGFLGLFVGSFLNVCVDRYVAGTSIVYPPSHCEACQARLRPWELIPLVSWLALRGKCAHCGAPISVQYPLMELITGLLYALVAWRFGVSWECLWAIVLTSILLVASGIDVKILILPDRLTYAAAVIALAGALAFGHPWVETLLGGLVGAGVFWLIAFLFERSTGREGLGLGDVKLMLSLGFMSGVALLPLLVLLSGLSALATFGILALLGRKIGTLQLPFGPFLAAGGFITWLFGQDVWHWWLTWILGL